MRVSKHVLCPTLGRDTRYRYADVRSHCLYLQLFPGSIFRVSLLTDFEDVEDPFDWELGTHGIHIHFEDPAYTAPPPTDSPASMSSTDSSSTANDNAAGGLRGKLSGLAGSAKKKALGRSGARTLSATYLPDVPTAQGWNKEETLDSAMRKAGYK